MAGTGTAAWWAGSRIVPGLVHGVSQLPDRRIDGVPSGNREVEPDLSVPSDPGASARGRDPQLDAAMHAPLPETATPCPEPPSRP